MAVPGAGGRGHAAAEPVGLRQRWWQQPVSVICFLQDGTEDPGQLWNMENWVEGPAGSPATFRFCFYGNVTEPRPSGWDPCNKSSGPWSHTFRPGCPSVAVVFRMAVRTGYVSSIPDLLLAGLGPSAMSLVPTPVLDTPHLLAKEAEAQSSGLSPSLWSWWGRAGFEFRLDALPTAALQVHASRCSILTMVG